MKVVIDTDETACKTSSCKQDGSSHDGVAACTTVGLEELNLRNIVKRNDGKQRFGGECVTSEGATWKPSKKRIMSGAVAVNLKEHEAMKSGGRGVFSIADELN